MCPYIYVRDSYNQGLYSAISLNHLLTNCSVLRDSIPRLKFVSNFKNFTAVFANGHHILLIINS